MFTPAATFGPKVHDPHLVFEAIVNVDAVCRHADAMRLSIMAETSSGFELISGAPEQFTLIPTVSLGEMKWDQASRSSVAPVNSRMPRESILFTALASTRLRRGVYGALAPHADRTAGI